MIPCNHKDVFPTITSSDLLKLFTSINSIIGFIFGVGLFEELIKILPDGVVMKCVDENYTGDGKEFFVFANFIHSNTSANQRNLIAYPENELEFFNDKISTLKELSRI